MRFGVLQKGLILVAVPVVLEIILISVLGYLLHKSDILLANEVQHAKLAMDGARLAFANTNAGAALVECWTRQDFSMMPYFESECKRIDKLAKAVKSYRLPEGVDASDGIMQTQAAVTKRLREFGEITNEGFGLGSMRAIMAGQAELRRDLNRMMILLRRRYRDLDNGLPIEWRKMEEVQRTTVLVLQAGIAVNLAVAIGLLFYFRRSFVTPTQRIRKNLDLMANKDPLLPPLPHTDEIAELDRTLHSMVHELEVVKEREHALFRNSSDVIGILTSNLLFSKVNPATKRMWGMEPEDVLGKPVSHFLSAESFATLTERLEEAKNQKKATGFVCTMFLPDKKIETFWSVFWSPDASACHCVIHDISEAKELEKQREAYMRLIASDFRLPLSRMNGLVDDLVAGRDGSLPEAVAKKIRGAAETLGRMVSMVDELIDLETLKENEIKLNRKDWKVRNLIDAAIKDTESMAASRQVVLEVDCADDLVFAADFDRVVRVLVNFVSNAIKFSPNGSKVLIRASKADNGENHDSIKVEVIDRGRGISAEGLAGLFQPYKQVEAADGKRGKGTGLGLVVCKRVIEQHGGVVGADSTEGQGSKFWFILPVQESLPRKAELSTDSASSQLPAENMIAGLMSLKQAPLWGDLSLKKKGLILVGIPLLFQCAFVGLMMTWMMETGDALTKEIHNREIARTASRVCMSFFDIMVVLRRPSFSKEDVETALSELPQRVDQMVQRTEGDEVAKKYAQPVLFYVDNTVSTVTKRLNRLIRKQDEISPKLLERYANGMVSVNAELGKHVERMIDAVEKHNEKNPARIIQLRKTQAYALAGGLLLNVGIAVWLAMYFSKDVIRRLLVMSDNSRRLALSMPLNPPIEGKDEIANLDKSFHETADSLIAARARESAYLDNAQNIIAAISPDGKFVTVNRASSILFGIESRDLIGRSFSDLLAENDRDATAKCLEMAKQSNEPITFETRVISASKPVDLSWSVLWSDQEKQFYAVAYDITQQRDLERMKQEFMALLTHDLRTPLTTIQGLAILLQTGALGQLPAGAMAKLAAIKGESDNILELVNDLLDMSKLESGQAQFEFHEQSFAKMWGIAEELSKRSGVKLVFAGPVPETSIFADQDRLPFALAALFAECFENHSAEATTSASENMLKLKLSGPAGADSKDVISRLSADKTAPDLRATSRRFRLSIAKRILQMHKAEIQASEEVDQKLELAVSFRRGDK